MVARLVGELLLAMGAPWHKGTVNTPPRLENQVEKREIKWTPGLCFCFVGTMGVTYGMCYGFCSLFATGLLNSESSVGACYM